MLRKIASSFRGAAVLSSVVLWCFLSGCLGDMPHRGTWNSASQNKRVARAVLPPDAYRYYSDYGIYYNSTRETYVYLENGNWTTSRSIPWSIPAETLLNSSAVPMPFHDSPSHHHASVVRDYPPSSAGLLPLSQKNRETNVAIGGENWPAR